MLLEHNPAHPSPPHASTQQVARRGGSTGRKSEQGKFCAWSTTFKQRRQSAGAPSKDAPHEPTCENQPNFGSVLVLMPLA
eukprot:856974-Prymnesium_polylepis.1